MKQHAIRIAHIEPKTLGEPSLKIPIDILFHKLDDWSKQLWMRNTDDQEFPALQTFYDFLATKTVSLANK